MLDKNRLIKFMMLTTSDQDGEALNALRRANKMLKEAKINWEELLTQSEPKGFSHDDWFGGFSQTNRGERKDSFGYTRNEWDGIVRRCYQEVQGRAREFIESIHDQWVSRGSLSPKQKAAILKFYDRLNQ